MISPPQHLAPLPGYLLLNSCHHRPTLGPQRDEHVTQTGRGRLYRQCCSWAWRHGNALLGRFTVLPVWKHKRDEGEKTCSFLSEAAVQASRRPGVCAAPPDVVSCRMNRNNTAAAVFPSLARHPLCRSLNRTRQRQKPFVLVEVCKNNLSQESWHQK